MAFVVPGIQKNLYLLSTLVEKISKLIHFMTNRTMTKTEPAKITQWADSVVELPYPAVCLSVCAIGFSFFRPLLGPEIT